MRPPSSLLRFALSTLVMLAATGADAKVKIVATTASLAALARDVGGLDVEVEALAAPTDDPHRVEAKPELVTKLAQADLLIVNGLDLEAGWLPKLQAQAQNPKIAAGGNGLLDASTLVDKLEVPAAADQAHSGVHPRGNPHYLYDPTRAAKVAQGIAERIGVLEPALAQKVRERAAHISEKLEFMGKRARFEVQKMSPERRRVVTYHKSFTYLVAALGLEELAFVEPQPGAAPDPAHLAALAKRIKEAGGRVIVMEECYPRPVGRTLAEQSGARVSVLKGGPRMLIGDTYLTHAERTVNELLGALER